MTTPVGFLTTPEALRILAREAERDAAKHAPPPVPYWFTRHGLDTWDTVALYYHLIAEEPTP